MRLLLSAAVAIAAPPAVATANAGAVPVENVATNWVRQLSRNSVKGQKGFYRTSFEANSALYELETSIPTAASSGYTCVLRQVATNENGRDNIAAEAAGISRVAASEVGRVADEQTDAGLSISLDAMKFAHAISEIGWRPSVWSDDGEIVFEWIDGDRHAIVSIEGDGRLGYTMLIDGEFKAGKDTEVLASQLPSDLLEYLISAA